MNETGHDIFPVQAHGTCEIPAGATNEELLGRACAGDRDSWAALYERCIPEMVRHAASIVGPEDAEDVVHDVFVSTVDGAEDGKQVSNVSAWLHTCVRNRALNARRSAKVRSYVPIADELDGLVGQSADECVNLNLQVETFLAGLASLPVAQRAVFVAVELRGMSYRQAAAHLGMSDESVRQRLTRSRRRIRDCMNPRGEADTVSQQ